MTLKAPGQINAREPIRQHLDRGDGAGREAGRLRHPGRPGAASRLVSGDGASSQQALSVREQQLSMEQVYINGKLIGGNDSLQALIARGGEWEALKASVAAPTA